MTTFDKKAQGIGTTVRTAFIRLGVPLLPVAPAVSLAAHLGVAIYSDASQGDAPQWLLVVMAAVAIVVALFTAVGVEGVGAEAMANFFKSIRDGRYFEAAALALSASVYYVFAGGVLFLFGESVGREQAILQAGLVALTGSSYVSYGISIMARADAKKDLVEAEVDADERRAALVTAERLRLDARREKDQEFKLETMRLEAESAARADEMKIERAKLRVNAQSLTATREKVVTDPLETLTKTQRLVVEAKRKHPNYSYAELGEVLGGKSKQAVQAHVVKIKEKLNGSSPF